MPRKLTPWRQPLLEFPTDQDDTPLPQDDDPSQPEGGPHALQDDDSGTPPAAAGDARPAPPETGAASNAGTLRHRTEDQARYLEGTADPGQARPQREPERNGSPGNGPPGNAGPFALRVAAERQRSAYPRRSHGVSPASYAA